jgi:hypothetical protein
MTDKLNNQSSTLSAALEGSDYEAPNGENKHERKSKRDSTEAPGFQGSAVDSDETKGGKAPTSTEVTAFSKAWTSALVKVRKPISRAVVFTSDTAARYPKTTVTLGIVSSLILVVIGLFTNFYVEVAGDVLWTPTPSTVLTHGEWIRTDSGFPASPRWVLMTVHADGENVLSQAPEGLEKVYKALDVAVNTEGYQDICKEATVAMQDENGETTCRINSATRFWNYTVDSFTEQVENGADIIQVLSTMQYPDGTPVDQMEILGNAERDSDGRFHCLLFWYDPAAFFWYLTLSVPSVLVLLLPRIRYTSFINYFCHVDCYP